VYSFGQAGALSHKAERGRFLRVKTTVHTHRAAQFEEGHARPALQPGAKEQVDK
jgi:hypothetical protein